MLRRGEVYENPVTGERAIVLLGTQETNGERLIVDLYVRRGGAVPAEHLHPEIHERFTVVEGEIGFALDGIEATANPGETVDIPPGLVHDWWNNGAGPAHAIVEISPAARFEACVRNGFCLAQDGKTDEKGMPNLLQLALYAREFDDVIRFVRPPRWQQRILFALLTPIARLLGYRGSYPEYLRRPPAHILPEKEIPSTTSIGSLRKAG